jgi:hypothetical protein
MPDSKTAKEAKKQFITSFFCGSFHYQSTAVQMGPGSRLHRCSSFLLASKLHEGETPAGHNIGRVSDLMDIVSLFGLP